MEELVSKADYKEELGGGGKIMYIITKSISSYQQLQSHPPPKNPPCLYSTTYSTSVHKQARMGRISSKGGRVERDWIGRRDHHGNEEDLRGAEQEVNVGGSCHAEVVWSGRESLFTFTVLGDSHGRGPSTHSNELFTHTHSTHTHTHHYITENNSYITRPRGHRGNYNAYINARRPNKYKHLEIHVPWWQQKPKNVNIHKIN